MRAAQLLGTGARAIWPLPLLAALVVVVAELASLGGGASLQTIVVTGLVNLTLVVGLYIFVGNSGVFSFGSVAFVSIGAYTAGLLVIPASTKQVLQPDLPGFIARAHFSPVVATIIGGLVAAAVAAVLAVPLMRLNGIAAGLATFAVLVIVHTVANSWDKITNGPAGLSGVPINANRQNTLVWALIAIAAAFAFQSTAVGLRLRASREDEVAARALGVRVQRERRIAWILSAFFMGAGGALYGQLLGSFNPDAFYLSITFITLAMLVVGGMTSLSGAVIGAVLISVVAEFLHRIEGGVHVGPLHIPARPGLREVGLALIMLLILVLRPRGLIGGRELGWPFGRLPRSRRLDASQPSPGAEAAPAEKVEGVAS